MKLTDEMYEIGVNSKSICTVLDNKYVLLKKSMPIEDKELASYIERISKLKEQGVNIAAILDYRFIPGTTSSYSSGVSYTTGVFLEDRAQGSSLDSSNVYLDYRGEYDFNQVTREYLEKSLIYIEEIERRAASSQEVYDKFVDDIIKISKTGLTIDPKPLNFFYDEEKGYTIIDVIPNNGSNALEDEYTPMYVFGAVFGYGPPYISGIISSIRNLPSEYSIRLKEASKTVQAKIVKALRKYGFSDENIKNGLARLAISNSLEAEPIENLPAFIEERFLSEKQEEEERRANRGSSLFSGW